MAVCLRLSSITVEKRKKILNELTIYPKETEYEKKNPVYLFDVDRDSDIFYCPFSYYTQFLSNDDDIVKIKHKKIKCKEIIFEGKLTDYQKEIKDETFNIMNNFKSVLLSAYCGFGKTCYSIWFSSLQCFKVEVWILGHRINILEQWEHSIKKFCPNATYQIVKSKTKINKGCNFYIMNISNVPKRERKDYNNCGILIIDEAHTVCTQIYSQSLLYFCPLYVISLTATPTRTDGMDKILEYISGPYMIKKRMTRPFNVYVIDYKSRIRPRQNVVGSLDWGNILEQQCNDNNRNELIINIIEKFFYRNILVLCKRVSQSKYFYQVLKEKGEDVELYVASQKIFDYSCRILISTFSKVGVGFDHGKLDMLIMASDIQEGCEQYLGRVLYRSSITPIVIDFRESFRPFHKHMEYRFEIYKYNGGQILDFNNIFF